MKKWDDLVKLIFLLTLILVMPFYLSSPIQNKTMSPVGPTRVVHMPIAGS